MQAKEYGFSYEVYDGAGELRPEDAALLRQAHEATRHAYAPYSHFRVGAAARMDNDQIITGSNQENASFPAGLCAEGVLLATAASLFPGMPIHTIAVTYHHENGPNDHPISPCGICRQSLQEFEQRTGKTVRLILGGEQGHVIIIPRTGLLLPFAFSSRELKS